MAVASNALDAFDMTLYHMKPTRSTRVVWLLHELKCIDKIRIEHINLLKGAQHTSSFRGMNRMSAVPTVVISRKDESTKTIMTESSGICLWLTDMVAGRGLKPGLANVLGLGQYYRFITFAASSMDDLLWEIRLHEQILPAEQRKQDIADAARRKFAKKVVPALEDVLKDKAVEFVCEPYHKGFTTADVMVGYSLFWADVYGLLDGSIVLQTYLGRIRQREEFRLAFEEKAAL